MKHLDEYKIFEGKIGNFFRNEKIKSICKIYGIKNYTINDDGSIDVNGNVYLLTRGLTEFPLKFNRVDGYFDCYDNKLTSLVGCPKYVNSNFYFRNNEIISLEGCPEYVGGNFDCSTNYLTSLVGCTKRIEGNFDCSNNNIISLEGCPEYIGRFISILGNPINSIVQYFIRREDKNNLIELFNYYDIVQGMNVIYVMYLISIS